jgi:hypothetical protein
MRRNDPAREMSPDANTMLRAVADGTTINFGATLTTGTTSSLGKSCKIGRTSLGHLLPRC